MCRNSGSCKWGARLDVHIEMMDRVRCFDFFSFNGVSEGHISTENFSVLLSLALLVLMLSDGAFCSQMPRNSFCFYSKSR